MSTHPFIIDFHQDIAYNTLAESRDFTLSAQEDRARLQQLGKLNPNAQPMCGWQDYQQAKIGIIIATIFSAPIKYSQQTEEAGKCSWKNYADALRVNLGELDFYDRLCDAHPDMYVRIKTRKDFENQVQLWSQPGDNTKPVGLVVSIEGIEGLTNFDELEMWAERGVHFIGPVWGGSRFFGGTLEHGPMQPEGRQLLHRMEDLGFCLDVAHMTNESILAAADNYGLNVICSHGNVRKLVKFDETERHLTDDAIRRIADHDGVIGVLPYNRFLDRSWKNTDPREWISLDTLADHIDAICQLTGSHRHAAIGSDADGGFGYPAIPLELNTLAELPLLGDTLEKRGYTKEQIEAIFNGNWQRILRSTLP